MRNPVCLINQSGIVSGEADLAMKSKALAGLEAPGTKMGRYKAPDSLVRFLQTL